MGKGRRRVWVLAGIAAAVAAYILAWQWDLLPRDVIATGTIETQDGKVLETREYYRTVQEENYKSPAPAATKREAVREVQLPSGRWIDCDPDCRTAAESALK